MIDILTGEAHSSPVGSGTPGRTDSHSISSDSSVIACRRGDAHARRSNDLERPSMLRDEGLRIMRFCMMAMEFVEYVLLLLLLLLAGIVYIIEDWLIVKASGDGELGEGELDMLLWVVGKAGGWGRGLALGSETAAAVVGAGVCKDSMFATLPENGTGSKKNTAASSDICLRG